MSTRALRRLQKQRELESQEERESDADSPELNAPKSNFNAFDLLDAQDANDEETDAEEAPLEAVSDSKHTHNTKTSKSRKKKQKQNRAKKGRTTTDQRPSEPTTPGDADLDDIDRALKELSAKNHGEVKDGHANRQSRYASDEAVASLCSLFAIDSKKLNAMTEMKRLFGSVAVESRYADGGEQSPSRRRVRNRQALDLGRALAGRFNPASRGQDLSGMALRKNILMQGKDEWPRATSGGLGMEIVNKEPSGVTEYKLVHNAAYKDAQIQFEICVRSMQAERMIEHLQFNPYHLSTLLQVSDIAKHQGDHAVSGDLLERALFNIGRSVQSSFGSCLAEGKARLSFDVKENRELWLAGWRYIINLGMKGTWKTAYEWAKLLLSLDAGDPYCICLTIDQLAIKAREPEHFIQLCQHPTLKKRWDLLPNIQCSLALAYFQKKDAKASREQLRHAIARYPWVFCRLAQELNINPVPKSIWGAQVPNQAFELLTELYINRAKDIWNTPEVITLFMEVADSIGAPEPAIEAPEISLNVARHVILSDIPAVLTHLPRQFTTRHISASDPLPPNELQEERPASSHWFFDAVRGAIGLDNAEELLGRFVPGGDEGFETDEWPEVNNDDTEPALPIELDEGLDEIVAFMEDHGFDPGNWLDSDDTPFADWITTLKAQVRPEEWDAMIDAAGALCDSSLLSDLLRDELQRQSEGA
ncbi:conserved hypothetical protein [Uncinocarpus reesii 1704]|uniref:Nulp1-pending protein n=1 Tax=Uncinocarpus reesii (strain UAMH 1704) TaxID=336963 RepID=C4JJY7_UNCRE|nr:uncharacterized protein UREG_01944 [Uncinocarpus reesii 1704]EEP77095.1 conserved hypothetical protein [Uncinocarpus reesii 1704]